MPRGDGFAFCPLLHAEPGLADVPVVAVTAATPVEETRARAIEAGCTEVIPKPFEIEDLVRVIERYLGVA